MLTGSKGLSFHGLGWAGASYFRTGLMASPFIRDAGNPVPGPGPACVGPACAARPGFLSAQASFFSAGGLSPPGSPLPRRRTTAVPAEPRRHRRTAPSDCPPSRRERIAIPTGRGSAPPDTAARLPTVAAEKETPSRPGHARHRRTPPPDSPPSRRRNTQRPTAPAEPRPAPPDRLTATSDFPLPAAAAERTGNRPPKKARLLLRQRPQPAQRPVLSHPYRPW